jgi:hypothetical protein
MRLLITIADSQHPGRTPQQRAHDIFIMLESAGVEVLDVKSIGDLKPKIVAVREEHGKPIITLDL